MSKKRKKHSIIPWLIAVLILAAALWALLANAVFVVRDVQVVGAGEVPEADVRHLSGIRLGARMSALDEAKIHLDVESDGRVAFVGLERKFPNRVVLTVRPRTMDALIIQAGKILVLDSDAYVVAVADSLPSGQVVYVTGIRASNYALGRQLDLADGRCAAMKAVVEALKQQGATGYVSELNVTNTADLRLISRTGATVLLGDASDMDAKVAWLAGALSDLQARGEGGGTLDVSSGTKADYRPAPTDTPAPAEASPTEAPAETAVPES